MRDTGAVTIAEVHEHLFAMMCAFADYCDAHAIRYYLCGGSLLGAIRHRDFIPWDDDVDILMPRPDYRRLTELMRSESIAEDYVAQSNELLPHYYIPYMKIGDRRAKIVRKVRNDLLWIDIFPMDGLPANRWACAAYLQWAKFLKLMRRMASGAWCRSRNPLKTVAKIPFFLYAKLRGLDYWVARLHRLAQRRDFDECEFVGGVASSMGPCERMKKADYLPAVDVEFHGRTFHAPGCWEKYLIGLYGDYMKLPPESERNFQHYERIYFEDTAPDAPRRG